MRLVCPNCGAQYEVPDDAIPPSGRDVQCSGCGVTWFHAHPDHDLEPEEELDAALGFNQPATAESSSPDPLAVGEEEEGETPAPEDDQDHDAGEEEGDSPAPPRHRLDPAVVEVLRQEAEYEARARAAEAENLESQPDLGLAEPGEEASRREREARLRMARLRGLPETPDEVTPPEPSRRERLPDIEEISSTLRSTSERRGEGAFGMVPFSPPEAPPRRGFRTGFSLMIGLAVILFLLYAYARPLAGQFPLAAPYLESYAAGIDSARLWLDQRFAELKPWISSVFGSTGEGG